MKSRGLSFIVVSMAFLFLLLAGGCSKTPKSSESMVAAQSSSDIWYYLEKYGKSSCSSKDVWYHLERNERGLALDEGFTVFIYEELKTLHYKGQDVLYCQAWKTKDGKNKTGFGIVVGYKASEPFTTQQGISAIKIKIISEKERTIIDSLLRPLLKGPVYFW